MNHVEERVLIGAAYQILSEMVHPFDCFTQERLLEIHKEFNGMELWLVAQDMKVQIAYRAAISDIKNKCENQVNQNTYSREVSAVLKDFPKP